MEKLDQANHIAKHEKNRIGEAITLTPLSNCLCFCLLASFFSGESGMSREEVQKILTRYLGCSLIAIFTDAVKFSERPLTWNERNGKSPRQAKTFIPGRRELLLPSHIAFVSDPYLAFLPRLAEPPDPPTRPWEGRQSILLDKSRSLQGQIAATAGDAELQY